MSSALSSLSSSDAKSYDEASEPRRSLLTEMYDYILAQHDGPLCGDRELCRYLDLGHFDALSQHLGLSLDDLSMYVLAYHLGCSPKPVLRISEQAFTTAVQTALMHAGQTATCPSRGVAASANAKLACGEPAWTRRSAKFAVAFRALRDAVHETNRRIWTDASAMTEFYLFMHAWGLRGTDGEERVRGALELWALFFRPSPHVPADVHGLCFHSYKFFSNYHAWFRFIRSPDFATAQSPDLAPISTDVWNQLLPFSDLPPCYDTYSELDAWPNTMDHFVQWMRR